MKVSPATYVESEDEAQTLEITLLDKVKNVEVVLSYSVFDKFDAIARSVKVVNKSDDTVKIQRVLSANVDFKDGNFENDTAFWFLGKRTSYHSYTT